MEEPEGESLEEIVTRIIDKSRQDRLRELEATLQNVLARSPDAGEAVDIGVGKLQTSNFNLMRRAIAILRAKMNVTQLLLYTLAMQGIASNLRLMGYIDKYPLLVFLSITMATILATAFMQFAIAVRRYRVKGTR